MNDFSDQLNSVEKRLIEEEYISLRKEILDRLTRISRLQEALLIGTLTYIATIVISVISKATFNESTTTDFLTLPLFIFFAIIPLAAIAIEVMCFSERDAIFRAGIYIRDHIENGYRTNRPKGWEHWLTVQGKEKRRRKSDYYSDASRRAVTFFYVLASSLICGYIISKMNSNIIAGIIVGVLIFLIYLTMIVIGTKKLNKIRADEFDSTHFWDVMVLDVDGCLLNNRKTISSNNMAAIRYLYNNGIKIILASGRATGSIGEICRVLGISGQHVVCHGAIIYDVNNNQGKTFQCMDPNEINLRGVAKDLIASGHPWVAFGINNYYCMSNQFERMKSILLKRHDIVESDVVKIKKIGNINSFEWPEQISKILCFVDVQEESDIKLDSLSGSSLLVKIRSTNETVEILHRGASKVTAVEEILKEYKGEKPKILAVGDYDNDIEMLKWADKAIAPKNASQTVKTIKEVLLADVSNDEDLIMYIVNNIYDIGKLPDIKEENG